MLQITEDTPPDMLAGAMDLTVHLPTGRSVKMSVERSTPMMDLLVQVTTNYQLQLSNHTLQVLGMAPSKEHSDSVLPYKPNTPIGALDTQHIKVVPKAKAMVVPKNVPPGHQPFESTFRLKVHLPRNQLYVTRVSHSVHLEDIMRRVCEEKNLDPAKYEFRHPGNLDEILDPKLTLSDYSITEIYLVQRGVTTLTQTFSSNDIMALRKEEERKQMHNKTGGGVFNLIFRRGKSSTGSLSSENRSISPTHSDDSRSVTPPAVQPPVISPPAEPADRPKPPQRKRRPAPKPPAEVPPKKDASLTVYHSRNSSDSSGYHEASVLSDNNASLPRRPKSTVFEVEGKPIGRVEHSQSTSNLSKMGVRSKSTSSLAFPSRKKKTAPPPPPPVLKSENTHNLEEPSPVVASQPCTVAQTESPGHGNVANNTNPIPTPRIRTKTAPSPRPRSVIYPNSDQIGPEAVINKLPEKEESKEALNTQLKREDLGPKLAEHQTTDDEISASINEDVTKKSSVDIGIGTVKEMEQFESADPVQHENVFRKAPVVTKGNEDIENMEMGSADEQIHTDIKNADPAKHEDTLNRTAEIIKHNQNIDDNSENLPKLKNIQDVESSTLTENEVVETADPTGNDKSLPETLKDKRMFNSGEKRRPEAIQEDAGHSEENSQINEVKDHSASKPNEDQFADSLKEKFSEMAKLQKTVVTDILESKTEKPKPKPPEVVALHPKLSKNDGYPKSIFDSYTRKRGFQIGSSLLDLSEQEHRNSSDLSTPTSVASALNAFEFVDDEIEGLDVEMFTGSLSKNSKNRNKILNQLHGMHELDNFRKNPSGGSLRSVNSLPGFIGGSMKKWNNVEELDEISLRSFGGNGWVIGDTSDTESTASTTRTPLDSLTQLPEKPNLPQEVSTPSLSPPSPPPTSPTRGAEQTADPKNLEDVEPHRNNELDSDWHYQLPSPPKAFRDSSPVAFVDESTADSVVTSPELFEKLKLVKDQSDTATASDATRKNQSEETASDVTSMVSEEDRPLLNKLSLENLEKRKSLVYNRVLATSLKYPEEDRKETFSSSLVNFEKTYDEVKQSSLKVTTSTLPNFKITTYNNPKQKVDIFEDETVRSNDRGSKRNSLQKSYIGRSMENISFRKNSLGKSSDEEFSKNEYTFYRPGAPKPQFNILRSESFTKEQKWVPVKPVSRSKSHISISKYKDTKDVPEVEDELTKSNSLFDVSGLQSLGVMRQIQNKLNTPNNSTEELDKEPSYQKPPESKNEVQTSEEKPIIRCYKYSPPSINMGTWSERPKIPVNVKEDPDYKYGTSKLVVSTVNNDVRSHNSIEIRNKTTTNTFTNSVTVRTSPKVNKNVSIKVNGFEPSQNSGNVVIKIGGGGAKNITNNSKPVFRKPLGNVNGDQQRPHSIALGSDFDISRVPVVRSVEFKKPYRDYQGNNTSVTQILPSNSFRNGFKGEDETKPPNEPKPVFRVSSYLQNTSAPVVRGFRNNNEVNTRVSWNQPHSFSTLPAKPVKNFSLDTPKPFSQANLRRTESTFEKKSAPPPAPVMPKFATPNVKREEFGDPKEQLLQAIRDFGGKKGLRAVKA